MKNRQNIPKIIHQIWIGPNKAPMEWLNSWKNKHPGWDYRLWTENNLPSLYNQNQFDQLTSYAGKADILRVEILYRFGGIYVDADSECLRPLDETLLRYHFFACYENEKNRPGLIANGVIGCEPLHPIIANMREVVHNMKTVGKQDAWLELGPQLLTQIIRQYEVFNRRVKILPSHAFYPVHHTGSSYCGRGKVYATQFWMSTLGSEEYSKITSGKGASLNFLINK